MEVHYTEVLCIIIQSLDKILQSLKNQEADKRESLDDIDQVGFAAIHYIVTNIHKSKSSLLEALVINGANVDLTTTYREGLSALHLAVEVCPVEPVYNGHPQDHK